MISVVIRTKNQAQALDFSLRNLTERYASDIGEIVVLDNNSTDNTAELAIKYGAKYINNLDFSYGKSANVAAMYTTYDIVVIFSAHAFPISHDFFKLIKKKFAENPNNLAGLRCLHNAGDYKAYINNLDSKTDYNRAGLIFAGSAFNKKVWEKHQFNENVITFEDKEWSRRVLNAGYEIDFVPSIFCYDISRTKEQLYFRTKNEILGSYQIHHIDVTFYQAVKHFLYTIFKLFKNCLIDFYFALKRLFFTIRFLIKKPNQIK